MVRKKSKFITIITFVLIAILGVGLIGVGVKLNNNMATKTISATEFSRGSVNVTTGAVDTTDLTQSVYSSYITVDGLKIELKSTDKATYKLFFYKADKTFISASTAKTSAYKFAEDTTNFGTGVTPAFVRIVVSPADGSQITLGNYLYYAGQLTITVNN